MSITQKRMYINGEFVENRSGKWIDVVNPATEQVISQIPEGSADDAKRAIDVQKPHSRAGKRCLRLNAAFGCTRLPTVSASAKSN